MRWTGFIIMFLLFGSLSYSDSRRNLSWEPVPGAGGYYLEIRNSDDIVITSTAVKDNFYEITDLEPGDYSFRVATINMLNQKGESSPWIDFTIERLIIPEVYSVSSRKLPVSAITRDILVKGKNLNISSRFFLRSSGVDIPVTEVEVKSEREVLLAIKPASGMKGSYDLVVVNRGGAEAVLKSAFEIADKKLIEQYYFTAVSYSVNVPVGAWSEYFDLSLTGASLYLQMPAFTGGHRIYYYEAELDIVRYNSSETAKKSSFTLISASAGISIYYPLTDGVQIFGKILAGPAYNILDLEEDSTVSRSLDISASAGTGIRYFFNKDFFVEPAFYWRTVFMADEFFSNADISLYAGVRF
jgi:hypothetical protein